MRCPFCSDNDTQVKDSRPTEDNTAIRRRRLCGSCGARFTSFERIQLRELMVNKTNGEREVFVRDKLVRSISIATRKRDITVEQIEQAVNGIIRQMESRGETDIPAKEIGSLVMEALSQMDKIAYIRYASVYKNFDEVEDFKDFIDDKE